MTSSSRMRGHLIVWDGRVWRYADTGKIADDSRPCPKCGHMPTPEGHDACLGSLRGVISACCGHGVGEGYKIVDERATE